MSFSTKTMRLKWRQQKKLAEAIDHSGRLLSEDRNQENLEFLERARKQFPGDAEIQLLYATTLLLFRPDDVALEAAKAVDLAPDDPVILVRAASIMLGRGEHEVVRSYTQRAKKLAGPNFILEGGIANLEGVLAAIDQQYDLAEERLRFAVEIDPTFDSFVRNLAKFLQSRARQAEAVEVINKALPQIDTKENLERIRRELEDEINSV
jgi:Flp pilus assembly protein TadD